MPNFILNINSKDDDLLEKDPQIQCCLLNTEMEENICLKIAEQLKKSSRILLLTGKNALVWYKKLSADGVLADLSSSSDIKKDILTLKTKLQSGVLGIICRNRRHEAMFASENNIDFIAFRVWNDGCAKTLELTQWYNELFLLQMALIPSDEKVDFAVFPSDILILTPEQYKIFVAKK